MKTIQTASLIILALFVFVTGCKEDEDPPAVPNYSTYYFEGFLNVEDVELSSANGYTYSVTLKRSTATQADDITVELSDASGLFGFNDGSMSMVLNYAVNEDSKTIEVKPIDVSNISAFESYDMTIAMVVPAGTPTQGEFSKSVNAKVMADYQPAGEANIAYGWGFAGAVYGVTEKLLSYDKDTNFDLYIAKSVYADGYDIAFGIDNGNVVIEDLQIMMITDPALFGAAVEMAMEVTATSYDSGANTVSLTYDMVRTDGGSFAGVPMTDVVDVYNLP